MNSQFKIAMMGSWNTDGGVSRHTTPIVEWLRDHCYDVKVFTHYRKSAHGYPLNVKDEDFVYRCFTASGMEIEGLNSFNVDPLLQAVENEGYNIFMAEDLGLLPIEKLLEIFSRIKAKSKTVLLNHDNTPKPKESPFWKFDWDKIINFLPEQDQFMQNYYPTSKIGRIEFPVFPISKGDRKRAVENMQLPLDKNIILTFGEYNMVDFLPALLELKQKDPSIYLLALVYDEQGKQDLERKIKELNIRYGYNEIRAENSSWQKRREYIFASQMVILDKGQGVKGSGAILSSTAYQIMSWGTPILARDNLFFAPFRKGEIIKYKNNEELKHYIRRLLAADDNLKEKTLDMAYKFCVDHSPEKISKQFLNVFNELLEAQPEYENNQGCI
ncbi:glycosyltransferase [bacterium]|nr:glycosyltransferase [bacterium]